VKFLGDIPDAAVGKIDGRISGLSLSAFDVGMVGLGVFPDLRRPRIVWAGVSKEDEPVITTTAEKIVAALEGVGEPEERDFRAHVTIGRIRSLRNVEALAAFVQKNTQLVFGRVSVGSLKLKSSVLTPSGPIYNDVREYVLK
jgi:2'-5' RNA ligase